MHSFIQADSSDSSIQADSSMPEGGGSGGTEGNPSGGAPAAGRGAPLGNNNAAGRGAPLGNKNAAGGRGDPLGTSTLRAVVPHLETSTHLETRTLQKKD